MKEFLLILAALIAFGCSNDDSPAPVPVEYFYSIKVKAMCPSTSDETIRHCVTKEVYDKELQDMLDFKEAFPNEPCIPARFLDINGVEIQDFYHSRDRHGNHNPCAE